MNTLNLQHETPKKSRFVVTTAAAVLLGTSLLLTGCGDRPNPLKTAIPQVAAQFLVNASIAAEHELKLSKLGTGAYFGACMMEQQKTDTQH